MIDIFWPIKEYEPRPGQRQILEAAISSVDSWDVCVIEAPTAFGKTSTSKALLTWASKKLKMKGMLLEPNNMLVKQISEDYKIPTLMRKDQYSCTQYKGNSCARTKAREGGYCKGCPYTQSLRRIRAIPFGVLNYYMYMAHKLKQPFLVVDEGHNAIPTLQEMAAKKIWQRDVGFPNNMRTVGAVREWLETCRGYPTFPNDPLLSTLNETLEATTDGAPPSYLVQVTDEKLRGKWENVIKLLPLNVRNSPPYLWPKVKKLVLMSATISRVDIEELGLDKKRVLYLKAPSPIPKERRPVVYAPIGSMSRASQEANLPALKAKIEELMKKHKGEKGIIHSTYGLNELLKPLFASNKRVMFHDTSNKQATFDKWTERVDDSVLFAAGMQEGLDLLDDLGRWQVVAKINWPSLEDTAVRWKMEQNQEWYEWQAIKSTAQACGRICRKPEDYGITYILDASWDRIRNSDLVPQWLKDAYEN